MPYSDSFQFDNRSLKTLLTQFREYNALIPFDGDNHYWDAFFFNDGQSPESLAALSEGREPLKGELLPHHAFLLAFFRMLETPVRLINQLPLRHRDFYFRRVLRAVPRLAEPDSVVLTFRPENTCDELNLPQGMLFEGARDSNGDPLHYQLDDSLLINHVSCSDVRWVVGEKKTIVLDKAERIDFPEAGVRLFSENETTEPVQSGRLLVLPELKKMNGTGRKLFFSLSEVPSGKVCVYHVVAGDWLLLSEALWEEENHRLVVTIPDSVDVSRPTSFMGFNFTEPVLKLVSQDPLLPAISGVVISVADATDTELRSADGVTGRANDADYIFGVQPALGDSARVMSPSWCDPTLTYDISLKPVWRNRPADLSQYYAGYPDEKNISNRVFKVNISTLNDENVEHELFGDGTTDNSLNFHRAGVDCSALEEGNWDAASKIELTGKAFQHSEWNARAVKGETLDSLNAPYTPQIASLKVSWQATTGERPEQYVLQSFGLQDTHVNSSSSPRVEPSTPYELYLGFTDILPGQQISLFFSINSPMPFEHNGINWEYLSENDGWRSLAEHLTEETDNLAHSGKAAITLPGDASTLTPLMPEGRYWIRASGFQHQTMSVELPKDRPGDDVQPEYEQWPWLYGVWTNGAVATLINAPHVANDHFSIPLPAGSISQPVTPFPGLAEVNQPAAGYGGVMSETDDAMLERLTNQLAHRGRTSTWRDISQLITDNFPEVHHVRLPGVKILDGLYIPPEESATTAEAEKEEVRIQEVMLVPRAGVNEGRDVSRPVFSPAYLQRVKRFITERASPWLNLHVLNPYYLLVSVSYIVHWKTGVNENNAQLLLEQAVRRRFMPWLEGNTEVILGSRLTISDIMLVLQQQSGVSWIEDVRINGSHEAIDISLAVITIEFTPRATEERN